MTPVIAAPKAERVLVGSVLRDPGALDVALAVAAPGDLADHPCRLVYQAAVDLRDAKQHVDAGAVFLLLRRRGQADDLGPNPAAFLGELLDLAPTAANLEYAAGQVRDASVRRKVAGIAAELMRDAASPTGPADELVEAAARRLAEVLDRHAPADGPEPIKDVLARALHRYDELAKGGGPRPVPTGFDDLDRVLAGGFRPRELVYVGARAGVGKSALLLRFAEAAARSGSPVLLHTLEMTSDEVVDRQVAANAKVPHVLLRGSVRPDAGQAAAIVGLIDTLGGLPVFLDHRPRLSVAQIAATARRHARRHGVRVLVVDYLQLVQAENRKANRYEQVGQISRDLKLLAGELDLVVVCAVQLNREAAGEEPELHHLRESGSLEQDANLVLLLHPKAADGPPGDRPEYGLKVAKQRNGLTGVTVPLVYARQFVRFEELPPLGMR